MQKAAPIEVDYDAFGPYDCSFDIYYNLLNVKFLLDLDIVKIKGEERFFSDCGEDDTCFTAISLTSDEATFEQNYDDYIEVIESLVYREPALKLYDRYK